MVFVNAWWEPLDFMLPATRPHAGWQAEIDTHDPAAQPKPAGADRKASDQIAVCPRSVVVLRSPHAQTQ